MTKVSKKSEFFAYLCINMEKIYDRLRKKHVALTPEEGVRQRFVDFLIERRGYPEGLMANEVGLTLNGTRRRCDTVVYDRNARPLAIVEYKAPSVAITQRVFEQIGRYNLVMGVKWLIVSNGLNSYCCRFDPATHTATYLPDIPPYDSL